MLRLNKKYLIDVFYCCYEIKWCENSSDLMSTHQDKINERWELIFLHLTGVAELPSAFFEYKNAKHGSRVLCS